MRLSATATAKDLYWMFSGNLISIVLAFVATIIIARFITQAEYGIYLALFAWSTLIAELADFGINTSLSIFFPKLLKQKKFNEVKIIYATAFKLELMVGILVMLASYLLLPLIRQTIFIDIGRILLVITVIETFFIQLTGFAVMTQAAYQKFKEFAYVTVFFGFSRLLFILIFWFFGKITLLNILLIQLASSILNVLYAQTFSKFPLKIKEFRLDTVKQIFKYSGFMGVTKIISAIVNRLDLLMLLPLAGATATGVYGAASRIAQIYPFLVTGFGQVIAPKMATFENGREAAPFLKKSILVSFLFLFTIIIFYLFAQPIILLLFGATYLESIGVFRNLLLALTGYILSVPFTTLLVYTYKRPQLLTVLVFIQLVIISVGNMILIPRFGYLGPTYSLTLANAVLLVLSGGASWYFITKEK